MNRNKYLYIREQDKKAFNEKFPVHKTYTFSSDIETRKISKDGCVAILDKYGVVLESKECAFEDLLVYPVFSFRTMYSNEVLYDENHNTHFLIPYAYDINLTTDGLNPIEYTMTLAKEMISKLFKTPVKKSFFQYIGILRISDNIIYLYNHVILEDGVDFEFNRIYNMFNGHMIKIADLKNEVYKNEVLVGEKDNAKVRTLDTLIELQKQEGGGNDE